MLKTMMFAVLGREQANNRGKTITEENPTMWHVFYKQNNKCFVLIHQALCLCKAYAVYLM